MSFFRKLIISTLLIINSVAIPIIQDHGCCIQYSYGSMMQPCCYKLTDILNISECNNTGLLGINTEYHNISCKELNWKYIASV